MYLLNSEPLSGYGLVRSMIHHKTLHVCLQAESERGMLLKVKKNVVILINLLKTLAIVSQIEFQQLIEVQNVLIIIYNQIIDLDQI